MEFAGWVVPAAVIAILPKCPACVAGYVAFATGIGISLPTASHLRTAIIALCLATFLVVALKRVRYLSKERRT